LKSRLFLLHLRGLFNISWREAKAGWPFSMIVCSCNVLSDHDVRSAVTAADAFPRTARQVYGCLGCSAECGRCARTIKKIIDEALGACAKACCSGCPHSQAQNPADAAEALRAAQLPNISHPAPAVEAAA
jgi:bacterioferritin-associated ferredoxin